MRGQHSGSRRASDVGYVVRSVYPVGAKAGVRPQSEVDQTILVAKEQLDEGKSC